ncbi:hypothetical protein, partial [Saccharopolyspora sp. 6V]|uniref:hypothetical protein n=1 Tax=Saccharopolyspora sp. 6V TaxID=2877239 RepID=UPI001CD2D7BC
PPPPHWKQPPFRQQPPRRSKALPVVLLLLAAVVLALRAAAVVALHGGSDAVRPERGSERLLQLTPGNPAVHYGTPAAFDACAVLPPDVLERAGLTISPNRELEHSYAKEDVPPERAFAGQEMSGCDYLVRSDVRSVDVVSLELYQQPRSAESWAETVADRATDAATEIRTDRGFQVATRPRSKPRSPGPRAAGCRTPTCRPN